MGKNFQPRVSKKERKTIDLSEKLSRDLLDIKMDGLLKDARLEELKLKEISVIDQVRTKFNDSSIRDLAENIRVNGLIQPLVVHLKQGRYTLICGERRYRAMTTIEMEKAPCFVLENKTAEELMAIQFSENSAREELHYIDKADGILNYQLASGASERQIVKALGISKSEVHRSLIIAKLDRDIKEMAKKMNIEKYVLVEYNALNESIVKAMLKEEISTGRITKRSELRKFINSQTPIGRRKSNSSRANPTLLS